MRRALRDRQDLCNKCHQHHSRGGEDVTDFRFYKLTPFFIGFVLAACQPMELSHQDHLGDLEPMLSTSSTSTGVTVTVSGDMIQFVDFYVGEELSPRQHLTRAPFSITLPYSEMEAGENHVRVVAGIDMLGDISTITRYVPFTVPSGPSQPSCNEIGKDGFHGCYYAGTNFEDLVFTRFDKDIQFNFGNGSPDSRIPQDNFSIRWRGDFTFSEAGTYRFTARADDGVRVSVNGKRIINEWQNQAATTFNANVELTKGTHRVEVEYYEAYSSAEITVSWQRTSSGGGGLVQDPTPTLPSDATYGAREVRRSKQPSAGDTFVSPSGSGSACTQQNPCSLTTGMNNGSFIWLMSGTYRPSDQLRLRSNKTIEALEPKKAIIDFQDRAGRITMDNNAVIRNIVVRRAGPGLSGNGIQIFGNNNLIEGVISEHNYYSGIAIWCGGYDNLTNPSGGSYNIIKDTISRYNSENCKGANNCSDSDADGISVSCGRGNLITHSEAHFNADDGIDVWRSYETTVQNSLATNSGADPNDASRRIGNGNGFKMGGPLNGGANRHRFINNWGHTNKVSDFSRNSGLGFQEIRGNVCGTNRAACNP